MAETPRPAPRTGTGAPHRWTPPRPLLPISVGLVGLGVITGIQLGPVRHAMEQDLARRSTEELRARGIDDVTVTFTGRDGVLRGTVTSSAEAEAARSVVAEVPGVRLADASVQVVPGTSGGTTGPTTTTPATPSPTAAAPSVSLVVTPGHVGVTGTVPDEAARAALVDALAEALPGAAVDDHLLVDATVSALGLDGLADVVAPLAALQGDAAQVTVTWQGGAVTLSGTVAVADGADAQQVVDRLVAAATALAGADARVTTSVGTAAGPTPEETLRAVLAEDGAPGFGSASCAVSAADRRALRRVVEALDAVDDDVALTLVGHTDSRGTERYNSRLGRCRARAVADVLVALGVDRDRLTVRSAGEADPVASNRTTRGRAQNRRVGISVS